MQSAEQGAIDFSVRVYRYLLLLCPAAFRQRYGALMVQAFRDTCRDASRRRGLAGVLFVWPDALRDVLSTALAEHVEGGIRMTRTAWIRVGSIAAVLGGIVQVVLALLTASASSFLVITMPAATSNGPLPTAQRVIYLAGPIAWLLLLLALIALHLRAGSRTGPAGWIGITCALIGVVLAFGANALFATTFGRADAGCTQYGCSVYDPYHWIATAATALVVGNALLVCGLLIYGVRALRAKALPRWNALPLLLGLIAPLGVLIQLGAAILAPHSDSAGFLKVAIAATLPAIAWGALWILLGRLLWSDAPTPTADTQLAAA